MSASDLATLERALDEHLFEIWQQKRKRRSPTASANVIALRDARPLIGVKRLGQQLYDIGGLARMLNVADRVAGNYVVRDILDEALSSRCDKRWRT